LLHPFSSLLMLWSAPPPAHEFGIEVPVTLDPCSRADEVIE